MSGYCVDVEALIEGGHCWGVLGICLGWGKNERFNTTYCDGVGVFQGIGRLDKEQLYSIKQITIFHESR